jgi:hypothetical protein
MVDHAGVVSINVFLAENGVLLPLDSIEEVKSSSINLKTTWTGETFWYVYGLLIHPLGGKRN